MKIQYFPETDSLYIDLSENVSVESQELSNGIVADYDKDGNIVGIDIDNAAKHINLSNLETYSLPLKDIKMTA